MDLMKWLNSLDELLYEVMSWLVFFPITLWRVLSKPLGMMEYADNQLALPEAEQYADTLSPPLFLALALVLAHGVATALGEADALVASKHGMAALIDSDASALVLRMIVFAAFPLVMAARLVRRRGLAMNRENLRYPFYAQCYPSAVAALGLSAGAALASASWHAGHLFGLVLILSALVYFLIVETRWFSAQLNTGLPRAFGAATLGLFEGFLILLVVGFLFAR